MSGVHSNLPLWAPQMMLTLQASRLRPEGQALVLLRPLVPLLKEELRATGQSGGSQRCHCCHLF